MQVTFLGTGDAFCSGGRNQTCFHIKLPQFQIMLDFGATSMQAMHQQSIDSNTIDGIVISHFHGDHFGGLPYFLLDAHFMKKRSRPLHVVGPPGIKERVEALMEITYPGTTIGSFSYTIDYHNYQQNPITLGPLTIEAFQVVHAPESMPYGVRISYENIILGYSGDTGWTDELYPIADTADLFICECNFFQTKLPSHLNYQLIKEKHNGFSSERIILTHLGPEMLECWTECDLECAYDGLILNL